MHRRRQTAAVQSVKRKKYDCSCFKLVELWPWSAIINKNINTTLPWRARRISAYSQYNTLPYLRAYPVWYAVTGVGLARDSGARAARGGGRARAARSDQRVAASSPGPEVHKPAPQLNVSIIKQHFKVLNTLYYPLIHYSRTVTTTRASCRPQWSAVADHRIMGKHALSALEPQPMDEY